MVESNSFVKKNDYDTENKLLLKEIEMYDGIVAEGNNETKTLNSKIKYDKLMYYLKSADGISISFNDFNCPLALTR